MYSDPTLRASSAAVFSELRSAEPNRESHGVDDIPASAQNRSSIIFEFWPTTEILSAGWTKK